MAHEDQFTAKGPPIEGSGMPRTGFSTNSNNMEFGANMQGQNCGAYSECVAGESSRNTDFGGIGAYGYGDTFGVFGRTHNRSTRSVAGVFGHQRTGGIGVAGAALNVLSGPNEGVGVLGVSDIGMNPLAVAQYITTQSHGKGIGVLGRSGLGNGVEGHSTEASGVAGRSLRGAGVRGESQSGTGVLGRSTDSSGVRGESDGGNGVHGTGRLSTGVRGESERGSGVYGTSREATAVVGLAVSAGGVSGRSFFETGVTGTSNRGTGVLGTSRGSAGVRATSTLADALVAVSQSGRGGVFGSGGTADGLVAQIGLVPQPMPVAATVPSSPEQLETHSLTGLPRTARGGDLLVTQAEDQSCTLWFCARGSEASRAAVWRQVLLGSPVSTGALGEILWAGQVVDWSGTSTPTSALKAPNGTTFTLGPDVWATFGSFAGAAYPELAALLGPGSVLPGDVVAPDDLARSDVIAFERNGGSPAAGGGWESCDWTFDDGTARVSVAWNGTADAARDPHVVANGSVRGADYVRCFGAATAPGYEQIGDDEVISFLLFSLPELQTDAPGFTIGIFASTAPGVGEATPDVEAVGVIRRRP